MSTAFWIQDELEQRGIGYRACQHADAFTAQQVAQVEHISGHRVAKVVCVMVDGWPVELVLPASRRVMLDWVRELLHAREIRLASEREMEQFFTPHPYSLQRTFLQFSPSPWEHSAFSSHSVPPP